MKDGKLLDVGGGLAVHALDVGSGPALVFLHGSGPGASGWSNFRRNIPFFVENGFRVVAPDTLGFGRSSKPEDLDYGLPFVTGALRRALAALGVERCAVVGNSHGGAQAIRLALDHPDLVERLILMAPGGLEERDTYMAMAGIKAMVKLVFGKEPPTRDGLRALLELQLFDPRHLSDETVDERWQVAQTQPRRVLASLAVPNLAPELPALRAPVLGFWGGADQFCPVTGALALGRLPRARVTIFGDCGHWVMVEKADPFNRMCLEWLRE